MVFFNFYCLLPTKIQNSFFSKICKIIVKVVLSVRSCHVTYTFQSESTLYSCLNVKKLLARSRREIWSLSDCNWTQHLSRKRTRNHLAKLTKWLAVLLLLICTKYLSVRDITRRYTQMHRTGKYSQHNSIIWLVWLNGWVFVYELSGCGFESSCWVVLVSRGHISRPKAQNKYFSENDPQVFESLPYL